SPFLVDPARRNRWWFSGSLLTSKENNQPERKSALTPRGAHCHLTEKENQIRATSARSRFPKK
ncbi:hypothetical protein, partial [Faecalibacterium longum]